MYLYTCHFSRLWIPSSGFSVIMVFMVNDNHASSNPGQDCNSRTQEPIIPVNFNTFIIVQIFICFISLTVVCTFSIYFFAVNRSFFLFYSIFCHAVENLTAVLQNKTKTKNINNIN